MSDAALAFIWLYAFCGVLVGNLYYVSLCILEVCLVVDCFFQFLKKTDNRWGSFCDKSSLWGWRKANVGTKQWNVAILWVWPHPVKDLRMGGYYPQFRWPIILQNCGKELFCFLRCWTLRSGSGLGTSPDCHQVVVMVGCLSAPWQGVLPSSSNAWLWSQLGFCCK